MVALRLQHRDGVPDDPQRRELAEVQPPPPVSTKKLPKQNDPLRIQYLEDDSLAKHALDQVNQVVDFIGPPPQSAEIRANEKVRKAILKLAAVVPQEPCLVHIPFDSDSVGPSSIMDVQSECFLFFLFFLFFLAG